MFLTLDDLFTGAAVVASIAFFIGYRCGKSDQRDAEERRRITEQFNRYGRAIRGRNGN